VTSIVPDADVPPPAALDTEGLAGVFRDDFARSVLPEVAEISASYFDALARGDRQMAERIESEALYDALRGDPWRDWLLELFANYHRFLDRLARQPGESGRIATELLPAWQRAGLHRLGRVIELALAAEAAVDPKKADVDSGWESRPLAEFLDALEEHLTRRRDGLSALLVIELSYGRAPGEFGNKGDDRIQALAAERLEFVPRHAGDLLARLDRSRFALFISDVSGSSHVKLATHRVVSAFAIPLDLDNVQVLVRPRIGVAMSPDQGKTAAELLHCAQVAVTRASNGGGISIYRAEMDAGERLARRMGPALRRAVALSELEVFFHPQVDAATRRLVGLEALLRWRSSPFGFVSPVDVIAVAEAGGFMDELTQWLIQSILRQHAEIRQAGIYASISINLRPGDIVGLDVVDQLELATDLWKVPADSVIIEITEGSVIPDLDAALANLARLKEGGFRVSMDDFGTAYASLTYLRLLPLDELKVDQGFVRNILTEPEDERIVATSIDLGHRFGLHVVAEGVENNDIADRLQAMGCDILQGYFTAKPMPKADLIAWARTLGIAGDQ
jgi:predicted signal transduction protein with EAL and GGDEF domain